MAQESDPTLFWAAVITRRATVARQSVGGRQAPLREGLPIKRSLPRMVALKACDTHATPAQVRSLDFGPL